MNSSVNIASLYEAAKEVLSPDVFAFIEGGSFDELTLRRNAQKIRELLILPRMLRLNKNISTQSRVFGENLSSPIIIAPTAYQCLVHEEGELATLEAANHVNTIFTVGMFSSVDYRILAEHAKVPLWFQMYLLKDRAANERLLKHVENLGYRAIVLTVDAPVYGGREREKQNPLKFPEHINFSHLKELGIDLDLNIKTTNHFASLLDSCIGWDDVEWISKITSLPIILKGILDPRDTEIALRFPQIKGVIISNHGGRQLDSTLSPLEVIEEHRRLVKNKISLFLDGAISRGSDIFKSIALGADAVLVGRSVLWGLAAGGRQGVESVLQTLHHELINVMALSGCSTLQDISRDFVRWEHEMQSFETGLSRIVSNKPQRLPKIKAYG